MTSATLPMRSAGEPLAVPFADLMAEGARPAAPAWLAAFRRRGVERFAAVGLPTSKDEDWRFTPVQGLARESFAAVPLRTPLSPESLSPFLVGTDHDTLLVLVDGRFDPSLSRIPELPAGARVLSLARAIAEGVPEVEAQLGSHAGVEVTPFAALNSALFTDGLFLHLAAGVALEAPVQVLHISTGAVPVVAPRSLILVGRGASATVTESFVGVGAAPGFTNGVTEIVLGRNARCEHVRVQRENPAAWHIGLTEVVQERDSHYRSFTLALGAKLSRHDLRARLGAENVETLLYGLYLGRNEQTHDNHTAIFHDQPNCNSWEVYKGVMTDRSHAVFNGKVLVQPVAQKTDAKQTNRNLLLSESARVDTKPQLEIFADDVKCTHGATVGKVDEQQRYYLKTRGIAGRVAEGLLIWAFTAEVLAEVTNSAIRDTLEKLVRAELETMIG
jgi:Fe-S cluster assembly protein SufD